MLRAADRLAVSKHPQIAQAWQKYRPLLYLAVDCGLRPQEYLALASSAVHDKHIVIERAIDATDREISVTKTPAGMRTLEASPEVLQMLQHYIEHHSAPNEYELVFPSETGT